MFFVTFVALWQFFQPAHDKVHEDHEGHCHFKKSL